MTRTDKPMLDDKALDAFFDAARRESPQTSDALVAAILDDAAAHRPQGSIMSDAPILRSDDARAARGIWGDLVAAIGGWPALAGMATATVAGLWIGIAAPTEVEALSGGLIAGTEISLAADLYALEDLTPGYLNIDILLEDEG
ncbi:hypothetical protein [Aliiroseovarius sediminis]|uniref:hypothetical protein n=1 Tax=Aliiroseovarius sediminis TaxID=2925839 RepID=UPI001F5ADBE0|nr:hypothetical protein [Aliiroseovarius sediminis]MCI2393051.1 hypothetical protein [Aliiroseovarius sediminis]